MVTETNKNSQPGGALGELGQRIRARRRELRLSQEAIAAPYFTKSYISAVERGKVRPSLKALDIVAARLGVEVSALLAAPEQGPTSPEVLLVAAEAHLMIGEDALAQTALAQVPDDSQWAEDRAAVLAVASQPMQERSFGEDDDFLAGAIADLESEDLGALVKPRSILALEALARSGEGEHAAARDALIAARTADLLRRAVRMCALRRLRSAAGIDVAATPDAVGYARELLHDAHLQASMAGDEQLAALADLRRGELERAAGDLLAARRYGERCEFSEADAPTAARVRVLLAQLHEAADDHERCDGYMSAAFRRAVAMKDAAVLKEAALAYGDIWVQRGDHERAAECYRVAVTGKLPGPIAAPANVAELGEPLKPTLQLVSANGHH